MDEFNHAVQIDPNYGQAYNGLGLVYAALGEDAKADANFKKAIKCSQAAQNRIIITAVFYAARKRYDESIAQFLAAVKNPLYATPNLAYANAGICSVRKNDIKNAEIYLNKALQIDPLTHSAAHALAEIQFKRGDAKGCTKNFAKCLNSLAKPRNFMAWH